MGIKRLFVYVICSLIKNNFIKDMNIYMNIDYIISNKMVKSRLNKKNIIIKVGYE